MPITPPLIKFSAQLCYSFNDCAYNFKIACAKSKCKVHFFSESTIFNVWVVQLLLINDFKNINVQFYMDGTISKKLVQILIHTLLLNRKNFDINVKCQSLNMTLPNLCVHFPIYIGCHFQHSFKGSSKRMRAIITYLFRYRIYGVICIN